MQFDVHPNPIPRARRAFPLVVILQADIAETGRDRLIALMAPLAEMPGVIGRLTPIVEVQGHRYVLMLPSIAGLPGSDLQTPIGNVGAERDRIVAGLDWLFLGV